jgi:hypothetical protein
MKTAQVTTIWSVKKCLLLFCYALLISSCANTLTLSEDPAQMPPKLERTGIKDENHFPIYRWDRPQAFAKLRLDQKAVGDAACLAASSDLMAIGYHPQAQNADGRAIKGGGYLCARKMNGNKPDQVAPQLVTTRGLLGWDRPGAFGYVPAEAMARGGRICKAVEADLVPVGFHPNAKDESGQAIVGGGFFCASKAAFLQAQ